MEHEVYVPFPAGTVRQALTEPERVARCVPGVQLDADAAPHIPEGRLRLRIGSSTITYRGTLTIASGASSQEDAELVFEAKGTESRGDGAVALTLTVRLVPATEPAPGTTLACTGALRGDGRLAEATDQAAEAAGRRLLDRFAENLAADLERHPVEDPPQKPSGTAPEAPSGEPAGRGIFETEVPPPSLDAGSEVDAGDLEEADDQELDEVDAALDGDLVREADLDGDGEDELGEVPAEAAHARRTMIGRSAEEVDHAPPRGRYAPVPPPEVNTASATLRWAAPAAAVVLASAVVVGRVLRRRR
ncbi:SRPBCC domain-containing protein [Streptomyces natalensis]|uniref:Carbon monoxide dehydrogenase subunit G n=1 Tax=Streptomyces natalensis ATCC 27448 TaxID=1240678 RepID=A0A0D7CW04_9ACTN|nr:SRPBCC domain-containing protein [Streptomyces natalensis]KIZ19567.1 carbon monoxide dehydrogenase subunit G [Streptomyces natalensis ATCC 27448]